MIVTICTETVSRGGRGDEEQRSRKRADRKILRDLLSTSPRPPRETVSVRILTIIVKRLSSLRFILPFAGIRPRRAADPMPDRVGEFRGPGATAWSTGA